MDIWGIITFIIGVVLEFVLTYILEKSMVISLIIIGVSVFILFLCLIIHKRYPKCFGEKCSQAVIGIVFNHDFTKTVLVYNKRQKKFLPPGGHAGRGEKLHELVKNKVKEETGLDAKFILEKFHDYNDQVCISVPQPFAVQLEDQPTFEGHDQHYDFVYLMKAENNQTLSDEFQARWCSLDEVEQMANQRRTYMDVYQAINTASIYLKSNILCTT